MQVPANVNGESTGNPTQWRLLTQGGFAGAIGGSGKVFGTAGFQDILILDEPGTVELDASFNKGGDIVRLSGDADQWQVVRSGSVASFTDGDTFVRIPAGVAGMIVIFDDGPRLLRIDTLAQTLKIGTQVIAVLPAQITGPSDNLFLPDGVDPSASGLLLLMQDGEVAAGGKLAIYGTSAGDERVHLLYGDATLDASFNHGGDTLQFDLPATSFLARQAGSAVFLNSAYADARIPAGIAGMALEFAGGEVRELVIDNDVPALFVGTQQIDAVPMPLTFA